MEYFMHMQNKDQKCMLSGMVKETLTMRAYNLGVAVGMYQGYRYLKLGVGKELADKCFSDLNKNDDYTTILRTLIKLDEKENMKIDTGW